MRILKNIYWMIREVIDGWNKAGGSLLAASLAYYTIFSLAPLLVIAIWLAGIFFGESAATGVLLEQTSQIINPEVALVFQTIIENASQTPSGGVTAIISIGVTLIGASIVFVQLKRAINLLWGITPQPGQGVVIIVRTHLFSFILVLTIASLLLVTMILSGIFAYLREHIPFIPISFFEFYSTFNLLWFFIVFFLLFAIILKTLPDASIAWKDVWLGAGITSALFVLGEFLIGYYLQSASLGGAYGTASSIVVILVWIYYSMHIILLGAKFTQVYANHYGNQVKPSSKADLLIRKRVSEYKPPDTKTPD